MPAKTERLTQRAVRFTDAEWNLADALAAHISEQTGYPVTRADVIRKALSEMAARSGVTAAEKKGK